VTERCNLACQYCSVYKNPRPEVDLLSTKKIIDRIAKMGVANLSLSGGEPLIRKDIFEIIRYASAKIPYVRVTSNGTLPLKSYQALLETPIDGFSISVDAASSSDPEHEKHLENSVEVIDYLFKNKGNRRMNLSTSLYANNGGDLKRLVEFCAKRWPGLQIFIQPTVVGKGNLRAEGERVDPSVLFELSRYPNVSNTEVFNKICMEYFKDPNFLFNCRAGRLFFGVRPNGEFWACHDVETPLNILDDDFFEEYKKLNLPKIADPRKCGSCIYSCYINLQSGIDKFSLSYLLETLKKFGRSFEGQKQGS
jgi:MoaA/NifB/PqqE/SkfB family radical SAM enzyme